MALKVGDKAPSFKLIDTDKKERSLDEFKGKKVVVAFYPAAFTGVCEKELCTFRDSLADLGKLNAEVVAISVDGPFANKAFATKTGATFPLLSDFSKEVSKTWAGLYDPFAGIAGYTAAKRSVFVVENGTIKYAWISEDPGKEPNYDEVKKALN